jgi:hypothetical protein
MKVEGGLSEKKGTIERRDKRRGVNKHLYMYENIMMKRIKMYPTKIRKLKKKKLYFSHSGLEVPISTWEEMLGDYVTTRPGVWSGLREQQLAVGVRRTGRNCLEKACGKRKNESTLGNSEVLLSPEIKHGRSQ